MTTDPPACFTCQRSRGPVRPAAGEYHRDKSWAVGLGCALEQPVNRWGYRPGSGCPQTDFPVAYLCDPVRRHHENHAVGQSVVLLDRPDGQGRVASEDLLQVAGAVRVQVLRDQDRRGEVGRKTRHQARERFYATRRGPHHDELRYG